MAHKSPKRTCLALGGAAALWLASGLSDDARRPAPIEPAAGLVLQLELDDQAITPVTVRIFERAIRRAEEERATCLVVVLDTPGGLVDSTRDIVKAMLNAPVPIVVFVPTGGRAASAGVFLTLASHVAAMAPGSHIGAAHPVEIGGLPISPPSEPPGEEEPGALPARPDILQDKIVNDTAAWARALADLRGRNATWAASAVRDSISATAEEAVEAGVVDLLARDVVDLLARVHGRQVVVGSQTIRLDTLGARVSTVELWWTESILAVISDPNIAFLLLLLGFYGILFELYSPGWGIAGTLGAISLVLAFFALAVLPINYVGLLLIAVALGMFVAEAFVTSYGALALGGAACLVLGGMMLVDSPEGFLRVSITILVPVAAGTLGVTLFLIGSIVRAHRARVQVGAEALVGGAAVAQESFATEQEGFAGTVRTHAELWRATSSTPVTAGQQVEVAGRQGMTLRVRALDGETEQPN